MTALHYEFRPASMADLALLTGWLAQPHVRAWWDAAVPFDASSLHDPRVARWIVSLNGRPFAYLQDYAVHGWDDHHFAGMPAASRGIDQYIGEPDMIGRGHGTAFIAARMEGLFADGAPMIATDPHPDNARAIAVYRKLGFAEAGPPQDTRWGRILPMHAKRTG